jgi:hypothetical protein
MPFQIFETKQIQIRATRHGHSKRKSHLLRSRLARCPADFSWEVLRVAQPHPNPPFSRTYSCKRRYMAANAIRRRLRLASRRPRQFKTRCGSARILESFQQAPWLRGSAGASDAAGRFKPQIIDNLYLELIAFGNLPQTDANLGHHVCLLLKKHFTQKEH